MCIFRVSVNRELVADVQAYERDRNISEQLGLLVDGQVYTSDNTSQCVSDRWGLGADVQAYAIDRNVCWQIDCTLDLC